MDGAEFLTLPPIGPAYSPAYPLMLAALFFKEVTMGPLAKFKGQNGILLIHEEYIEISRKSLGGFSSQGSKGDRQFYYSDINAIEYKTPMFFSNGYFKIIAGGTKDVNANVGLFGSSMDSMKDPNTVILRAFSKKVSSECDLLYKKAMSKLNNAKSKSSSLSEKGSNLDELKKLGELLSSGILTQEEFESEKKKILGKT
ncbi:MAG: SHOCT domain-containing protein [Pseudomonadaceae bacterium]|nr:SHOCT domain-containing protein [Pseudomonadaceae bacterium]